MIIKNIKGFGMRVQQIRAIGQEMVNTDGQIKHTLSLLLLTMMEKDMWLTSGKTLQ
jgi:hypothetical protein